MRWGLLLRGLSALILCASLSVAYGGAPEAVVVYSGNLDGELAPCGCSAEGELGGILRQATVIEQFRRESPTAFLISSGGLLSSATPRDRLKSEYILKAIAALGYDAMGIQWQDLAYGTRFLARTSVPWVVSNAAQSSGFSKHRMIRRAGTTMAFFAWLDPEKGQPDAHGHQGAMARDDSRAIIQAARRAKRQGAITVLSTELPLEKVQARLPLRDVDLLLVRAAYEAYGTPRMVGHTLVLQPGSRGTRLARVSLRMNKAGRIADWKQEVIELSPSVPDSPRFLDWYAEYNAKVKEAYLVVAQIKKSQELGQSPYAGAQPCQACHPREFATWSQSAHAEAYERLEKVGKAFDPDCITCHVVGFDKPGGFIDKSSTPKLVGVQCESCHGQSRDHVAARGADPVGNSSWSKGQICGQCHIAPHSPAFALNEYWARIAH